MTSRTRRGARLTAAALALAALVLPSSVAHADDEPDTTPPQVNLDPCGERAPCRLVFAEVYGDLAPGDDLAVLGARIGDDVLAETVFDDGTGFTPYGPFVIYGNDVVDDVDYALSVEVPRGTSDITFYARDLEGNTSELTTTVLGPVPPGPVRFLTAEARGHGRAMLRWGVPDLGGYYSVRYTVSSPGLRTKHVFAGVPMLGTSVVAYAHLTPGWHRFTVRPRTPAGVGPTRSVRVFI